MEPVSDAGWFDDSLQHLTLSAGRCLRVFMYFFIYFACAICLEALHSILMKKDVDFDFALPTLSFFLIFSQSLFFCHYHVEGSSSASALFFYYYSLTFTFHCFFLWLHVSQEVCKLHLLLNCFTAFTFLRTVIYKLAGFCARYWKAEDQKKTTRNFWLIFIWFHESFNFKCCDWRVR